MFINDFPIFGDRLNHISWDYKIHKTIQQFKWGDEDISEQNFNNYSHFW